MNWNSELQIAVFKTFGPLASLDIHISVWGSEQYQWATTIIWSISMAFLLQKKILQADVWKVFAYSGWLVVSSVPWERWGSISSTFLGWLRVSSFTTLVCNQKYQWMLQPKNNGRRHAIRIPLCWLIPFSLEQGGVYIFGILTSPGLKAEGIWAVVPCTYR